MPSEPALLLRHHRPFIAFWLARIFTASGFQMLTVAIGWNLYQLTGNVLDLGLVGLVEFAPRVLFMLHTGHVADRYERRRVAAICQTLQALIALALVIGSLTDNVTREMIFILAFLLGACLLALPLIELRGWPIIAIGIPSLYFTYGYTGGPWPLAYKGLGEIFVILFFGLVAVLGTILVQIGTAPVVPGTLVESLAVYNAGIVTGIQCGLLCAVMISVNNIRDRKEDLTTGKRTLAVRLALRPPNR